MSRSRPRSAARWALPSASARAGAGGAKLRGQLRQAVVVDHPVLELDRDRGPEAFQLEANLLQLVQILRGLLDGVGQHLHRRGGHVLPVVDQQRLAALFLGRRLRVGHGRGRNDRRLLTGEQLNQVFGHAQPPGYPALFAHLRHREGAAPGPTAWLSPTSEKLTI